MGNYDKGDRFGGNRGGKKFGGKKDFGGRSFGGDRGGSKGGYGGGRDGDRPEMHKATCSDCGNSCEVPFRPTGDKPVFCSNCFKNKRDDGGQGGRDDRGARSFGDRNDRPRYDDRRPRQDTGAKPQENYKVQFEQLNAKLDRVLKALTPAHSEVGTFVQPVKNKKFEKAPNKGVDKVALKKVLSDSMTPEPKKASPKKKVAKKVAAKKTPTKKAPAKKVAKKAPAKKKK